MFDSDAIPLCTHSARLRQRESIRPRVARAEDLPGSVEVREGDARGTVLIEWVDGSKLSFPHEEVSVVLLILGKNPVFQSEKTKPLCVYV